jgi:hypothetical protein
MNQTLLDNQEEMLLRLDRIEQSIAGESGTAAVLDVIEDNTLELLNLANTQSETLAAIQATLATMQTQLAEMHAVIVPPPEESLPAGAGWKGPLR